MNDVQHALKAMFHRREADLVSPSLPPPPTVRRRVRRRQITNTALAVLCVAALVGGSIVGLDRVIGSNEQTSPADPVLPVAPEGSRSVSLPRLSIAYPENWYLLMPGPGVDDNLLQLTNFDPGLAELDCDAGDRLPDGGVALHVRLGAPAEAVEVWPQDLGAVPGPAAPCGADQVLAAQWTIGDRAKNTALDLRYAATALVDADATPATREALTAAFGSMTFPADGQPQVRDPFGYPALVVDSMESARGPLALYVYEEGGPWIGVLGIGGLGAVQIGNRVPMADEAVTMDAQADGAVVWGTVSASVARAELFTIEGESFPAELVGLPPAIGGLGLQAVWGFVDRETRGRVTTLLYDTEGNVLNDHYPTAAQITVGEGTHPDGGPWRLYLEITNEGAGLSFEFERGGGGGGCCLEPLRGRDLRLSGYGSSSDQDEPAQIDGLASTRVATVTFVDRAGTEYDGELFPMPEEVLGPAQAFVIFVPNTGRIVGEVRAYDASGSVLATESIDPMGEPPGPTAEIDAVWSALRAARDSVGRYLTQTGSFAGITPEAMHELVPEVTFNASESAVANEVSLRGATARDIALVSTTTNGEVYCIAVNMDEGGGGNYRYGTQDAAAPEECRGGWE